MTRPSKSNRRGNQPRQAPKATNIVGVARGQRPQRTTRFPPSSFVGKERLCTIGGQFGDSNAFIASYQYNPGLKGTFPVGYMAASNYDQYKILPNSKNKLRYVAACATTTPGTIYLYIDYDPTDVAPANEEEFANQEGSISCSSWQEMELYLSAAEMGQCSMQVRSGPVVTPLLLTDACTIHIGAFGFNNTGTIGHVAIEYDAKLMKRQPTMTRAIQPRNLLSGTKAAEASVSLGLSTIVWEAQFNSLGSTGLAFMTLPAGTYRVFAQVGLRHDGSNGRHSYRLAYAVDGIGASNDNLISEIWASGDIFTLTLEVIQTFTEGQALSFQLDNLSDLAATQVGSGSRFNVELL
jgi:hypothetical protein